MLLYLSTVPLKTLSRFFPTTLVTSVAKIYHVQRGTGLELNHLIFTKMREVPEVLFPDKIY